MPAPRRVIGRAQCDESVRPVRCGPSPARSLPVSETSHANTDDRTRHRHDGSACGASASTTRWSGVTPMDHVERLPPHPAKPTDLPRPVPRRRLPAWVARLGRWCWTGLRRAAQFLLIAWAALALYYSNLPW